MMTRYLALLNPAWHISVASVVLRVVVSRWDLVKELIRREISERYAGEILGTAWAFGHPLINVATYVLVFSFIFRGPIRGSDAAPYDYATFLLCGMVPWQIAAEVLNKSPSIVLSHQALAKQIVFPLEILPVKSAMVAFVTQVIGMSFVVLFILARFHHLPYLALLLPAVMLFQLLYMIGVSYALAAIGVYFRDIKDFIAVFLNVGLFISPVIYAGRSLPDILVLAIAANPFSTMIWVHQDVLYNGTILHPYAWIIYPILSVFTFSIGFSLFQRVRSGFGNQL